MQDLRVSSLSRFTRWPFCLSALLFLFIMHGGCLATPARRGVIDSHRGPLHNRRTADKGRWGGGQWCISWFWLGIRVLNSHGSPRGTTQGWWEIESGISGYACFFIFLLQTPGEGMSPKVSHVPKIPGKPPPPVETSGTEADIKSQTHRNEAGEEKIDDWSKV